MYNLFNAPNVLMYNMFRTSVHYSSYFYLSLIWFTHHSIFVASTSGILFISPQLSLRLPFFISSPNLHVQHFLITHHIKKRNPKTITFFQIPQLETRNSKTQNPKNTSMILDNSNIGALSRTQPQIRHLNLDAFETRKRSNLCLSPLMLASSSATSSSP